MTGARDSNRTKTAVGSVHLALTPSGEAMTVAYTPPWACSATASPASGTTAAITDLAGDAMPDATILIESRSRNPGPEVAATVRMVRERLPTAEALMFDPGSILRFLWCFRDVEDPLALARAADRTLFDESYFDRPVPEIRSGRRSDRRKATHSARRLLRRMATALGVAIPFPRGEREESSWGLSRTCSLIEAGLGLYAGLLRRWGSPLAVVREESEGLWRIELMDRWLRTRAKRGRSDPLFA